MGELLDRLPSGGTSADVQAREVQLLAYAQAGALELAFYPVTVEADGHELVFLITADGLKLEGVRLSMSARLAQQIADFYGFLLPTPKISDLTYRAAVAKLKPMPMPITATLSAMVEQSAKIDRALGEAGSGVLMADIGKDWVLVNQLATKPGKAANYGWHVDTTPWGGISAERAVTFAQPGAYVIQGVGTAHNDRHADYSQIQRFVGQLGTLDGEAVNMGAVLTGPLAGMVSHEGSLKLLRQPIDGGGGGGGGGGESDASPKPSGPSVGQQVISAAIGAAVTFGVVRGLQSALG